MQPDYDQTRRFLLWLYPDGPWTLTAISLNKKTLDSEYFTSIDEAVTWASERGSGRFNLYYSVNQPTRSSANKKKFSKQDIASAHFLHVDVDPRTGEDVQQEQQRILKQLTSYKIPPSIIIFSGGGYNALWRLSKPIQLAVEAPEDHIRNAIEVERRNWQFELDFGTPDHCRDISRILRLPGTINWPNADKVAKGRVPALAAIHEMTDVSYEFSMFMATPSAPLNLTSSATKVTQDIKRIESVDELEIPEQLKKIIVQGCDPDEVDASKSRSEWLFYVCCELVRHGIQDEIIHGVITDSRFGISESVLDKGSGVTRYALRQITRARDKALHPRLMELNEEFAVIGNYGGKCVVMSQDEDGRMSFRAPREFFNSRASSHIIWPDDKGKEKRLNDGEWWFKQPRRRQYEYVVFEPSKDVAGSLNLFRGFPIQPVSGDLHHSYLEHIYENICSGHEEYYQYLIKWMARVIQRPATQSEVAVVLIGGRGTGKSVFCNHFKELFGPHGANVDNMEHLTGKFNSHLADKILLVAEEAYHVHDRQHESVLKELITGSRRAIERKGFDVVWRPNYIHLMMTSNNDKVVPVGDHERRFFVLQVGSSRAQQSTYFAKIDEDLRNGGYKNLMHFLLNIDLSDFEVRAVPKTEALVQQHQHGLSYEQEWLLSKLREGVWLADQTWEGPILTNDLYRDYQMHLLRRNVSNMRPHHTWHAFLMRELPGTAKKQISPTQNSTRPMAFIFQPIWTCRQQFVKNRGWPSYDWEHGEEVEPAPEKPSLF